MALTPDFSVSQLAASPDTITLTDNSTGSDGTIINRLIFIQLANGNYLSEDGEVSGSVSINWPYSDNSISIAVLPRSEAPTITVYWENGSGSFVYSKIKKYCFSLADYIFALGLTLRQVANNSITADQNYYSNKMQLIVNDMDADNAILYINDTTLAQNSLNRAYDMIQNENKYF